MEEYTCHLSDAELIDRYPLKTESYVEALIHAQNEYEKEFPLNHTVDFDEFIMNENLRNLWTDFSNGTLNRRRKDRKVKVDTYRKAVQYIRKIN